MLSVVFSTKRLTFHANFFSGTSRKYLQLGEEVSCPVTGEKLVLMYLRVKELLFIDCINQ